MSSYLVQSDFASSFVSCEDDAAADRWIVSARRMAMSGALRRACVYFAVTGVGRGDTTFCGRSPYAIFSCRTLGVGWGRYGGGATGTSRDSPGSDWPAYLFVWATGSKRFEDVAACVVAFHCATYRLALPELSLCDSCLFAVPAFAIGFFPSIFLTTE